MDHADRLQAEQRARSRAQQTSALIWNVGAFVVVNAILWIIDAVGGGAMWAYWVTIFWGLAIVLQTATWLANGRRLEDRLTERYMREGDSDL